MSELRFAIAILAWLAILGGGWLGWQLLRQNGRLLLRLEEIERRLDELEFGETAQPKSLPIGSEAPAFESPDLEGKARTLAEFRGQPVLLIFFNPDCGFCRDMMPKLAALGGKSKGEERPFVMIITSGDAENNRQFFAEHKVSCPVLLQKDGEVVKAYQANGTPSGYMIGSEGKIASSLAMGAETLLALATGKAEGRNPEPKEDQSRLTSAATQGNGHASRFGNRSLARSRIKRDGLKAGTPAPDFQLPRLDGHGELTLSELRGKRVLLVFSSPHCGPCNALAPELEKFHRKYKSDERPPSPRPSPSGEEQSPPALEVVMVSRGEPKENRAKVKEHGLTFPVVLQQQWEISRRYAMFATPVAYLIDEAGIIDHDVAIGTDAIKDLVVRAGGSPELHHHPVGAVG